jgi:hypothetical protein
MKAVSAASEACMSETPKIDPEKLAAAIDGRMDSRERDAVMAELAASPEDLEILGDVLAVEQGHAPAQAIPIGRGARKTWRNVAAAAAVVLVATSVYIGGRGGDTLAVYGESLATRGAVIPPDWNAQPWGVIRGGALQNAEDVVAVRIGARMTDLVVAIRANDAVVPEIANELAAIVGEFPGGAVLSERFAAIGHATAVDDRLARAADAEQGMRARLDEASLRWGAWLEAARLAAQRNDAEFFGSRESRQMLRQDPPAESEDARTAWEAIRASAGSSAPAWDQVLSDLTLLLAMLGG